MPITPEQRELRKQSLGSSDMAAVLGVDPYRSAYDIWADKTGRLGGLRETPAMAAGTLLQDSVLDWYEPQMGAMERDVRAERPGDHLHANIDAVLRADRLPVEVKTGGLFSPTPTDWGEDGTDDVPPAVIVQAHVHMLCLGDAAALCHVLALLGGRGFVRYAVPRNAVIADMILAAAHRLWGCVTSDTPPEHSRPTMGVIRAMRRVPSVVVPVPRSLYLGWQSARDARLLAERAENDAKEALLAALGDAECGDIGEGEMLEYRLQKRREHIVRACEARVLRVRRYNMNGGA